MRVPIDASPALLPSKRCEPFDQRPARPFATRLRRNKNVLKVANHLEAPGVGMQDIIGEALWFTAGLGDKDAPNGLARSRDSGPDSVGDFVRNRMIEGRAIGAPQHQPMREITGLRRT